VPDRISFAAIARVLQQSHPRRSRNFLGPVAGPIVHYNDLSEFPVGLREILVDLLKRRAQAIFLVVCGDDNGKGSAQSEAL